MSCSVGDNPAAPSRIALLTAPNTYRKSTLLGLLARRIVLGDNWKATRSKDFPGAHDPSASLNLEVQPGVEHIDRLIAVSGTAFDRFPTLLPSRQREQYVYIGPRSNGNLISRSQTIQALGKLMLALPPADIASKLKQCGVLSVLGLSAASALHFRFRQRNRDTVLHLRAEWREFTESLRSAEQIQDFALEQLPQSHDLRQIGRLDGSQSAFAALHKRFADAGKDMDLLGWDQISQLSLGRRDGQATLGYALTPAPADQAPEQETAPPRLSNETISLLAELGWLIPDHLHFLNAEGRTVTSEVMSSGEFQLLTSITGIALAVRDNSLILIDEPENSLHPAWQARYIELLSAALAQNQNVQVLIATHSPLLASGIAQDAGEILIGRKRSVNEQTVIAFETGDKLSYGHSVDELLVDYFGLPIARNHYFAEKLQLAVDLYARNATQSPQYAELAGDLRRFKLQLSANDPLQDLLTELLGAEQTAGAN